MTTIWVYSKANANANNMSWRNSIPTKDQVRDWNPKDDEYRKYMRMSIGSIIADNSELSPVKIADLAIAAEPVSNDDLKKFRRMSAQTIAAHVIVNKLTVEDQKKQGFTVQHN